MKSRVILEPPPAHMSSRYLCGTTKPDMSHIVHELYVRDVHGERQRIRALIDCGATTIFMAPRLLRQLGLPSEPAHITTLGLDSRVMMSAKDSRKTTISCQYFEHLAQVDEPDVLVVPMTAYDLVLGLPWFQSRNPEIDWSKGQLLGLRTPVGNSGNEQTITSLPQGDGSAEDGACKPPPTSVSNGSGQSLRVWVRVGTEPEPDWWSGSSINPNCRFGYGSIDISLPV